MAQDEAPLTMTVPEAGKKYLRLSAWSSYQAVKSGVMPVIRIGRTLRVPVRSMERMLDDASTKAA